MAGIGTRKLMIEIDSVEYSAESSNVRFTSAEGDTDFVTFADALAGGSREYKVEGTFAQDAAVGSVWSMVFDETGTTVPITLMPYGNPVPSVIEPHFTASAIVSEPDGDFLGGEANASATARMTFDIAWTCEAKPLRVTT